MSELFAYNHDDNQEHPKIVFLISGKRTVGKDTVTEIIKNYLTELNYDVCLLSFSGILKESFSRDKGYDLNRLMNDYVYKENHREEMTEYFMNMRKEYGDGHFRRELMKKINETDYDVYIVSDLRLMSDAIAFMRSPYKNIIVRIEASEESKKKRGWVKKSCDDDFTETDLDNYQNFDKVFNNDGSMSELFATVRQWMSHLVPRHREYYDIIRSTAFKYNIPLFRYEEIKS